MAWAARAAWILGLTRSSLSIFSSSLSFASASRLMSPRISSVEGPLDSTGGRAGSSWATWANTGTSGLASAAGSSAGSRGVRPGIGSMSNGDGGAGRKRPRAGARGDWLGDHPLATAAGVGAAGGGTGAEAAAGPSGKGGRRREGGGAGFAEGSTLGAAAIPTPLASGRIGVDFWEEAIASAATRIRAGGASREATPDFRVSTTITGTCSGSGSGSGTRASSATSIGSASVASGASCDGSIIGDSSPSCRLRRPPVVDSGRARVGGPAGIA